MPIAFPSVRHELCAEFLYGIVEDLTHPGSIQWMELSSEPTDAEIVKALLGARDTMLEIRFHMHLMGQAAGIPVGSLYFDAVYVCVCVECSSSIPNLVTDCTLLWLTDPFHSNFTDRT